MELTAADLALLRVEVGGDRIDTGRIAHEDHLVGQLFWLQVKVKTRTIGIDDQFGFWEMFLTHRLFYLVDDFDFCVTCLFLQRLVATVQLFQILLSLEYLLAKRLSLGFVSLCVIGA